MQCYYMFQFHYIFNMRLYNMGTSTIIIIMHARGYLCDHAKCRSMAAKSEKFQSLRMELARLHVLPCRL